MANESDTRASGYSLLRYGLNEYPYVISYKPNTSNPKSDPETYRFIASNIKGCYVSWSRSLPSGEVRIGSDIYLSIPNGWDERLCYYPWYTGHIYWQYNQWDYPEQNYENSSVTSKGARNNESVYRYYHGNETNLNVYANRNRFTDKLLVWYKKTDPQGIELSPVIENPSPPTDIRAKVRMRIFVRDDYTEVFFTPKFKSASSLTFSYDFGDGTLETYNQESQEYIDGVFSHEYVSAGYYVVDLIIESYDNMSEVYLDYHNDLVYTNSGYTDVIKSIYIYSPYKVLFNNTFNTVAISNASDMDYAYINVPNDFCSIIIKNYVNIDDLYILVSGEDQLHAHTLLNVHDTSHIDNIHLGTTVNVLDISGCNDVVCDSMYSYSLHPMRIVDYKVFDSATSIYDYSNAVYIFDFYVKPAVLDESQAINVNLPISVF